MYDDLRLIFYPDPRLKKPSVPVTAFDEPLAKLVARMFDLMREHKGVGLAAPQVGVNLRLFVTNPDGDPANDRCYVNPVLSDGTGDAEDEEGCLSLPKVNVNVVRSTAVRIVARDPHGHDLDQTETGYLARIWQHETDHLNGILLTDRMGPVAKLTNRKLLKGLEEKYADRQAAARRRRTTIR